MINHLIIQAFKNRFLTFLLFLIIVVVGVVVIIKTPVDALPDLSENQVIVMTEWPGQSPTNIEDQISYPLTVSFQGLPGVKAVRGSSQVGLSMITVIFEDSVPYYFARDRVSERLRLISAELPAEVMPVLGPDATGLGHIFMYTLESETHSVTDLRTIQDFTVKYALQSVDGVAEVASVGGYLKTYQILVDPVKLAQYQIPLMDIMEKVQNSNGNVSGKVITTGEKEVAIQGFGFFQSLDSLKQLVIQERADGLPLQLSDIATVRDSGAYRRSILADETGEKVGAIVVMRFGENPLKVIEGVKVRIAEIEKSLPEGVTIKPFYDRTNLIKGAIHTMSRVIVEEMIVTAIILAIFLYHFGATFITNIGLLVGVILTFIFMYAFGIPSNIMSLGGVAISIGTMVDAAIVITENIYRKLLIHKPANFSQKLKLVQEATLEVGRPILFAILITIVSFIPIFSLSGMEGKLFTPLAWTHLFGLTGALISALFLVPLLALYFIRGKLHEDNEIKFVAYLQKLYTPILKGALHNRKRQMAIVSIFAVLSFFLAFRIGSEFMPPLNEGTLLYMPITMPDISEQRAQEMLIATNKIIASFPEVESVMGKAGRASTATDPSPLSMTETVINLKPQEEWRDGMTKEKLIQEMNKKIKIENLWNGFTQPIIGRIDMISTGVRTQVGVKIYGDDPLKLEKYAIEAENILSLVPGAANVVAVRSNGLKYLNITLNEEKLAQFKVPREEVLNIISSGIGGEIVATTIEGRKRFGIEVRFAQNYRQNIEDIRSLLVSSESGTLVTLESVADVSFENGPAMISSEGGLITSVVQMNVAGTDLGSFVNEAKQVLDKKLELPPGYYVEWTGQYEHQLRAKSTLQWVVPAVLLVIFILLYLAYKDLGLVGIIMLTIPLSLSGGLIGLFLAGYNFSVAVWVGFITLFGTAVSMSVIKVVYLENAYRMKFGIPIIEGEGAAHITEQKDPQVITKEGIEEAIVEGATFRLRPILMTALVTIIGLIPMLTSHGTGAEVTKPLAVVLIGGLISSVIMTLSLVPVLFAYLRGKNVGQLPKIIEHQS
ncbi:MAG: efflux RND transporter permease subunit [Oligoflexales bacterium]|nr:efflux RND transporter permease subunit [Oligoflexales bacterium]